MMQGIRTRTLNKLSGKTDGGRCNQVVDLKTNEILSCVADSTMLWHRQLGHTGEKGFRVMHRKGMVKCIPDCSSEFDLCEHCIYCKKNHVSFPSKATREK